MRLPLPTALALLVALAPGASCSCTGAGQVPRDYPEPTIDQIVGHLRGVRERARTFRTESTMDYWLGEDRVKGEVLLMGQWGALLRFNGLNPTGDNVAADLACDGRDYQFLDYNKNCQLSGVCSRDAIAQLLRVALEPDDFVMLALGSTPVIEHATGTVRWDPDGGKEIVELKGADGYTQRLVLDGRERRWDVLESTIKNPDGKIEWQLQNKEHSAVKCGDGTTLRLPGKTRFEQPAQKADLIVRWKAQECNVELPASKFTMAIPAGLPSCAQARPAAAATP